MIGELFAASAVSPAAPSGFGGTGALAGCACPGSLPSVDVSFGAVAAAVVVAAPPSDFFSSGFFSPGYFNAVLSE
jgi:hypothetical protein